MCHSYSDMPFLLLKTLKCKPSAYSFNILSKYSSLISHVRTSTHRLSIFDGRHINHRSSKVDISIIGLRRSSHPSPKVDTSIFESRHIDLRRSTHWDIDLRRATHRSSKGDTLIFESRHIDFRKSMHRSSKIEGGNITPTICRRILSTTALLSPWSRQSDTCSYVHVFKKIIFNIRQQQHMHTHDPTRALVMY